uniref:Lysozyme n=1 Tax=Acrobeloides nanus TaxID=290746 RepID=A0A914E091_9BILA
MKSSGYGYYISRIYTGIGAVDKVGIQNLVNAENAGWDLIDAYLSPCLNNNTCPQPNQQVIDAVQAEGMFDILWIDVEPFGWSTDKTYNQQFITLMVNQAKALGKNVGIYTQPSSWDKIVGLDFTTLSNLPLWWAEGKNNTNFSEFSGWTSPYIQQNKVNQTTSCGITFYEDYYLSPPCNPCKNKNR